MVNILIKFEIVLKTVLSLSLACCWCATALFSSVDGTTGENVFLSKESVSSMFWAESVELEEQCRTSQKCGAAR